MDPAQARQKAKFDAIGVKTWYDLLIYYWAELSVGWVQPFLGQGLNRFNLANEINKVV